LASRFGELALAGLLVACGDPAGVAMPDAPAPSVETPDEPAVAVVQEARGDVRFSAAGSATWTPTTRGRSLAAADAIQTMEGATAGVRFHRDGSTVRLEPMTTLRVPEQPPRVTRLRHLSGRMVARLDPSAEDARLEVALPPGDLVIETERGADGEAYVEAQVEVSRDRTEIAMLHGRARLQRTEGGELEITQDRFVSVAPDGEVLDEGVSLPAPALLEPADGATERARAAIPLRWAPVEGATGYEVFVQRGEDVVSETVEAPELAVGAGGAIRWWVRARNEEGAGHASAPRAARLEIDRTPPALSLTRPTHGAIVRGPRVTVSGATDPGATVEVNGHPAAVGEDGAFEASEPVPLGLTNVVIRVTDDLGNSRVMTRPVLRER